MPTISQAANIPQLNSRLLELVPLIAEALEAATEASRAKKVAKPAPKLVEKLGDYCDEMKDASGQFEKLKSGAPNAHQKEAESFCKDLIRSSQAKLTHCRSLMGLKLEGEEAQNVFAHEISVDAMEALVRAYKADTREDAVWGGELEAHVGATRLGFRCNIYSLVNKRLKMRLAVGAGGASSFHLLHSGDHYQVVTDAADDRPLARCRVTPVPGDGNCLYTSLLKIHFNRTGVYNIQIPQLRQTVSEHMDDNLVKVAVIALAQGGGVSGLGSKMRVELDRALSLFESIDPKEYTLLGKGKALESSRNWTSMAGDEKDFTAHTACLSAVLDDPRLVTTMKTRRAGPVQTDGTYFAAWKIKRTEMSKKAGKEAYTVTVEALGGEKKSKGMTSNPNEHAEGYWFTDVNFAPPPPKAGKNKEKPVPPKSALETVTADASVVYLECHDSKAPCTDICTPRLQVLARLINKPILVFAYKDWGHFPKVEKRIGKLVAQVPESDNPFEDFNINEVGPIILFTGKGIFLVGLCDEENDLFFVQEAVK